MTPIEVQASPVERVQLEVSTLSAEVVSAASVDRVYLAAPTTISVTIGG